MLGLYLILGIVLGTYNFKYFKGIQQKHKLNETNNDLIIVHMLPHSHDDVGWLKTMNDYYFGLRNEIQNASVNQIIDSYIDELQKDNERRFI